MCHIPSDHEIIFLPCCYDSSRFLYNLCRSSFLIFSSHFLFLPQSLHHKINNSSSRKLCMRRNPIVLNMGVNDCRAKYQARVHRGLFFRDLAGDNAGKREFNSQCHGSEMSTMIGWLPTSTTTARVIPRDTILIFLKADSSKKYYPTPCNENLVSQPASS